jgi:hypothetical protein
MSKRGFGSVFMAGVFVFGASGPAQAAKEVQKTTFKGSQVQASFTVSTEVTCADGSSGLVIANGSLQGAESITVQTGQPTFMANGVTVDLSYVNGCTGTEIGFASGGIPNALTPPDKNLTSAAMVGSGTVQDFGTGQTIPVTINVSVEADGDLRITSSKSKSKTKTTIVSSAGTTMQVTKNKGNFNNANRIGEASGTISIEGFALNADFTFAIMNANDNTTKTITKL